MNLIERLRNYAARWKLLHEKTEQERARLAIDLAECQTALRVAISERDRLDAECDSLNDQLLRLECGIVDPEWAARLGYQFLRLNSKPNSLASRVADEIQAKLRGKTEFVGIELANPIIVEINHSA